MSTNILIDPAGLILAKINWINQAEGEIESIEFTNGEVLELSGSSQIGVSAVWANWGVIAKFDDP